MNKLISLALIYQLLIVSLPVQASDIDDTINQINDLKNKIAENNRQVARSLVWLSYAKILGQLQQGNTLGSRLGQLVDNSNPEEINIPIVNEISDSLLNIYLNDSNAEVSIESLARSFGRLERFNLGFHNLRADKSIYLRNLREVFTQLSNDICSEETYQNTVSYIDHNTNEIQFERFILDWQVGVNLIFNDDGDLSTANGSFDVDGQKEKSELKHMVATAAGAIAAFAATTMTASSTAGPPGMLVGAIAVIVMAIVTITWSLVEFFINKHDLKKLYSAHEGLFESINTARDLHANYMSYCRPLNQGFQEIVPPLLDLLRLIENDERDDSIVQRLESLKQQALQYLSSNGLDRITPDIVENPQFFKNFYTAHVIENMLAVYHQFSAVENIRAEILSTYQSTREQIFETLLDQIRLSRSIRGNTTDDNFRVMMEAQREFYSFKRGYASRLQQVIEEEDLSQARLFLRDLDLYLQDFINRHIRLTPTQTDTLADYVSAVEQYKIIIGEAL